MIKTMAAESESYKGRMGDLLKSKLLDDLRDRNYYLRELNGKLTEFGVPVSAITNVQIQNMRDVSSPTLASPTARSELYKVDLIGEHGQLLRRLCLQVYYSDMRRSGDFSAPISAVQEADAFDRLGESAYRGKHMSFWNELGLYAPYLFGIKKLIDRDSRKFAIGILTDYLDGATHHLDILAINARREVIDNQLSSPFLTPYIKDGLEEEDRQLKAILKGIPASALRTINDFAVIGTDALKGAKDIETKELGADEYLRKVVRYFNSAYKWHCKVYPNPEASSTEMGRKFRNSMKVLLSRIVVPERFVYTQGDEFLHHFQYRRVVDRNSKDTLVSVLFDADHARLSPIERARSKALLAPYLDLDYEGFVEYIKGANNDLEERLKEQTDGSDSRNRLSYIFKEPLKAMLIQDLWAIYEGTCNIGRVAEDDKPVNIRQTISRTSMSVMYNNPIILSMLRKPDNVPRALFLGEYDSRRIIPALTLGLDDRISRLLDPNGPYGSIKESDNELYESLLNLHGILFNFKISILYEKKKESEFKQRELPFGESVS